MRLLSLLLVTGLTAVPVPAKQDWLQLAFDQTKSANNVFETVIGPGNVNRLRPLFNVPLNDVPDGSPVLLSGVATAAGLRDLVYLQGERGRVSAFDARTGLRSDFDRFPVPGCRTPVRLSTPAVGTSMPIPTTGWCTSLPLRTGRVESQVDRLE
ncbi:hypothetical protein Lesp02_59270 [Lentzea sp. NBRC 105346]|uniref:hypothetical protein n=1 Tax=Lentzea sp. NBRC 105346 TaxID=3032205 RepID=UPI0024A26BDB|nr:hypothetical protein [Lentzea sp. NBRC 105346]GLZ33739.1 hypothetical protein Lesp02_59270 [Lentzea sp. NBRC 105346]